MSFVSSLLTALASSLIAGASVLQFALYPLPLWIAATLLLLLVHALRTKTGRRVLLALSFVHDLTLVASLGIQGLAWGLVSLLLVWALWSADPTTGAIAVAVVCLALWALGGVMLFSAASGLARLRLAFRHGHEGRTGRYASPELVLASLLGWNVLGMVVSIACLRPSSRPALEPIPRLPAPSPESVRFDLAPTVTVRSLRPDLEGTVALGFDELGWLRR